MRVLAIDTALGACAACVIDTQARTPQAHLNNNTQDQPEVMRDQLFGDVLAEETLWLERGHAEALLPLIERVVTQSIASTGGNLHDGFAALDRVAVTIGPGSFTGLRVGISAARAIGLAANVPVVGISTLDAMLAPLMLGTDLRQPVLAAAIDARHGALYFQATAPGGRIIVPARHISIHDAVRLLGTGNVTLAGPAAQLLANEALNTGLNIAIFDISAAPDIRWVARLGFAANPDTALPQPLYLRGADAKPQDKARLPHQEAPA